MQHKQHLTQIFLISVSMFLMQCDMQDKATVSEFEPFFGTYQGSASNMSTGEMSERDLTVTISTWEDSGFTVDWRTVKYRADGSEKESELSINFYRSARPGIYASAMRTDVFGHTVPYDPVGEDADPYVWAGLKDKTLTITALYIIDGGGYELQVYERTLNDDGMTLHFERMRNGENITTVEAKLERMNK